MTRPDEPWLALVPKPVPAAAELAGRMETVMDEPVNLSERRRRAAQQATDIRRRKLYGAQMDQATSRSRQQELAALLAAPAETLPEVAARARFLIQLYADTPEACEPRHNELIEQTLDDLARLCDRATAPS